MVNAASGFFLGIVILAAAGAWWYFAEMGTLHATNESQSEAVMPSADTTHEPNHTPGASIGDENLVEFRCDRGKTLTAVFTRDIVGLTLDDGRQMELRLDEDEEMYININGTIEFHGAGEGAYLQEGAISSYANCVALI